MILGNEATKVLPLIIPDNCSYDPETKSMTRTSPNRTSLQVYQPALEFIRSVSSRVGVIAIAGKARTGKSLVAGDLVSPGEQPCPFELGNTMDACTYGIWVATKTVQHPNELYRDMEILVMDVEGTDAHSADQKSDTQLMVVSLLITSLLIFNSKGVFDATSLDQIEFILQLTQQITCAKGTEQESGEYFSKFFPVFVWLLRDCHLDAHVDENTHTIRDYLVRHVLKAQVDFSNDGMRRTFIRQAFQNMFPFFDAFGLPPPHSNSELLKQLGTVDRSQLEPTFVEQLDEFVQRTLDQVPYKKILSSFGQDDEGELEEKRDGASAAAITCTGQHLAEWIELCVSAVNEGVPNIQSIGESVISRLLQTAFDTCVRIFKEQMETSLSRLRDGNDDAPVLLRPLEDEYNNSLNDTLQTHGRDLEMKNSNPSLEERRVELLARFQEDALSYYRRLLEVNDGNIFRYCKAWIVQHYEAIQALLENVESVEADRVIGAFNDFQRDYYGLPFTGESGHTQAWNDYVPTFKTDQEMFKRAKNWSEERAELAQQQAELEAQNRTNEANLERLENDQAAAEERFRSELERQRKIYEDQMKDMNRQMREEQQRIADLNASHNKELAQLHKDNKLQMEATMKKFEQTIQKLNDRPPPEPVEIHHHHDPECAIL